MEEQKYDYYIMELSPEVGVKQKLIGPFKRIEERDEECLRLQQEEDANTCRLPNGKRMSKKAKSFYRTNVIIKEADSKNVKRAA